jgi:hypothetical protein
MSKPTIHGVTSKYGSRIAYDLYGEDPGKPVLS